MIFVKKKMRSNLSICVVTSRQSNVFFIEKDNPLNKQCLREKKFLVSSIKIMNNNYFF